MERGHTSEHGSHARRLARHAAELREVLRGLGKVSRQPQQRRDLKESHQSPSQSRQSSTPGRSVLSSTQESVLSSTQSCHQVSLVIRSGVRRSHMPSQRSDKPRRTFTSHMPSQRSHHKCPVRGQTCGTSYRGGTCDTSYRVHQLASISWTCHTSQDA